MDSLPKIKEYKNLKRHETSKTLTRTKKTFLNMIGVTVNTNIFQGELFLRKYYVIRQELITLSIMDINENLHQWFTNILTNHTGTGISESK